nr:MAG TPA: hypothetical protein [Caudoviricetes sp.]
MEPLPPLKTTPHPQSQPPSWLFFYSLPPET